MPSPRRTPLLVDYDAQRYNLSANPIWSAYEPELQKMFQRFDGVAKNSGQNNWYVSRRWSVSLAQEVTETDSPEVQLSTFLAEPAAPRARKILLICGWTGCGKTTFVKHFFEQHLPDHQRVLNDRLLPLYIDCYGMSFNVKTLELEIDRSIDEVLCLRFPELEDEPHYIDMWASQLDFDSEFRQALWRDLDENAKRIEKLKLIDSHRYRQRPGYDDGNIYYLYNKVRLQYLAARRLTTVVLIWDNIDQAPSDIQDEAIRLAYVRSAWMPDTRTIITVREYTAEQVQTELRHRSVEPAMLHLHPPHIHEVLTRRAESASAALAGKQVGEEVSVRISDGASFLVSILSSLREPQNERILFRLSGYNVREQLLMVEQVMRSRHIGGTVDVLEAIRRYYDSPSKPWLIRWADLLEALICGDFQFRYSPTSRVVNLFDCGAQGFPGTLNRYYVLLAVRNHGADIERQEVVSLLGRLGHRPVSTTASIQKLLSHGLIWSRQGLEVRNTTEQYLKLSVKGEYYLDELMTKLMYLQHMGLVTPLEPALRRELRLWQPQDFKQRIRAGWALIEQISLDEDSQWRYAERHGSDVVEILEYYMPGRLSARLQRDAQAELRAIQESRPEGISMTTASWRQVINWFSA